MNAPSHLVHGLVNDFHNWTKWSPWEDLDPALQRSYSGPEEGVGARYEWSGNRKAGQGAWRSPARRPRGSTSPSTSSSPSRPRTRPASTSAQRLRGRRCKWVMTGEHKGVMAIFGKVTTWTRMIGPDFEKGLARLKAVAEETDGSPSA